MMKDDKVYQKTRKITFISVLMNVILSTLKIIIGILARSSALISDGIHSFSDLVSDFVVMFGLKFSRKPPDDDHNYGHDKIETIATAIVGIFLMIVVFQLIKSGVENIISIAKGSVPDAPHYVALIIAGISIIVKEILYQVTERIAKEIDSLAMHANAIHHRTDSVSSIAVLLGVGGAFILGGSWVILDPIASIAVSILIFKVAFDVLKSTYGELSDKAVDKETRDKIVEIIDMNDGIYGLEHLHTRIAGRLIIIELHIFIDEAFSFVRSHDITNDLEAQIASLFNKKVLITIHATPARKES